MVAFTALPPEVVDDDAYPIEAWNGTEWFLAEVQVWDGSAWS